MITQDTKLKQMLPRKMKKLVYNTRHKYEITTIRELRFYHRYLRFINSRGFITYMKECGGE